MKGKKKPYRKRAYQMKFEVSVTVLEYPNQVSKLHDKIMKSLVKQAMWWADPEGNAWLKDCKTGQFKGRVSAKERNESNAER